MTSATTKRSPLSDNTNRQAQFALPALDKSFLSVGIAEAYTDAVSAAAASPDVVVTTLNVHASSVRFAIDAVTIALCEILFEREVYPRSIFREQSKFGLLTHRLGSIHSSGDDALSAKLGLALSEMSRAEELCASRPAALCLDILGDDAEPLERWQLQLDIDHNERCASSEELRAEIGIVLKQVQRSAIFLPSLESSAAPRVRLHPIAEAAPRVPVPEDETEDADDDDDDDDEPVMPPRLSPRRAAAEEARQRAVAAAKSVAPMSPLALDAPDVLCKPPAPAESWRGMAVAIGGVAVVGALIAYRLAR